VIALAVPFPPPGRAVAVLFPWIDGMAQAVIDAGIDGVAQDGSSPGKTGSAGRASRSSMILTGTTLASEHGRRTLAGLRCEYRWEAPVRPEPGARAAAAGLRASRADRERVIDLLKAVFAQGRLDRDEFDARIGQALASRTYGELAAVTAGIPAELTAALPRRPPVRARRRIPFNTAVTGGACMAVLVNVGMTAALLSRSPVAVVLFVVFTIIGTILAIGAMIVAP
jgi:hypothetical protein